MKMVKNERLLLFLSWISFLSAIMMVVSFPSTAGAESTDKNLTAYIAALNANMPPNNNGAAVAALFTPDGVQYHLNGGGPNQKGRDELQKFFAGFSDEFANWTHVEKSRVLSGNRAVWEGTAQGNEKKTGKLLSLPIVFFLEFDNTGKVKENRVYVDVHLIEEQLK
jgi:ketosteroid isomerase-like protein